MNTYTRLRTTSGETIYAITCKKCGKQYVGQTYRSIRERFLGHIQDVNSKQLTKTIGAHYNQPDHNGWKDFSVSILFLSNRNPGSPNNVGHAALVQRLDIEDHWIKKLKTLDPQGLNKRQEDELISHPSQTRQ